MCLYIIMRTWIYMYIYIYIYVYISACMYISIYIYMCRHAKCRNIYGQIYWHLCLSITIYLKAYNKILSADMTCEHQEDHDGVRVHDDHDYQHHHHHGSSSIITTPCPPYNAPGPPYNASPGPFVTPCPGPSLKYQFEDKIFC